jgi:hypothetical protein
LASTVDERDSSAASESKASTEVAMVKRGRGTK